VARFEDQPSMRELGYKPHFTFAIYDALEIDEKAASEVIQSAAMGQAQLRVQFSRIRWFDGSPLVLWAEPTRSADLAGLHKAISAAIDPVHCRPHYRPGAWTPHCTLGTRIADSRREEAMAFARSFDRTIEVIFDVIDCVDYPPVRIVAARRLPMP
jgi:2'-5' RNA ligase